MANSEQDEINVVNDLSSPVEFIDIKEGHSLKNPPVSEKCSFIKGGSKKIKDDNILVTPVKDYPTIPDRGIKTVKDLDSDQQPREKAAKYGIGALSVPELWALILRTGTPVYTITELCRDMMINNEGNLHRLERRTKQELCEMKGMGEMKATQVLAVMELIRNYCLEDIPLDDPIRSSSQIYERMKPKIGNLDHEEIWMLLLNRRNQITKDIKMTSGTSTSSVFDVRQAIKLAILENSEGIILCHNHPSNSLRPSMQDDNLTKELQQACKFMHIRMLDHVIVTAAGYYSYNDSSKL